MHKDYAVILENINVKFNRKSILENINLKIEESKFVTIVGPNGSGKTTLLKTILGLIKPDKGHVKIFNYNPDNYPKGMIGYLPQGITFNKRFPISVFDVVLMGRYPLIGYLKMPAEKDREIVNKCLDDLKISEYAEYNFQELSGGLKQRVLIARALSVQPKLLILDEPTTSLDIMVQKDFYDTLRKLKEQKDITILMVTHDIGVISQYVDNILCLNRKVHYYGKASDTIPANILENVFGKDVMFIVHDKNCLTCKMAEQHGTNNLP